MIGPKGLKCPGHLLKLTAHKGLRMSSHAPARSARSQGSTCTHHQQAAVIPRPCWSEPCINVTNKPLSYHVHAGEPRAGGWGMLDPSSVADEEDNQHRAGLSEPSLGLRQALVFIAYTSLGGWHSRGWKPAGHCTSSPQSLGNKGA